MKSHCDGHRGPARKAQPEGVESGRTNSLEISAQSDGVLVGGEATVVTATDRGGEPALAGQHGRLQVRVQKEQGTVLEALLEQPTEKAARVGALSPSSAGTLQETGVDEDSLGVGSMTRAGPCGCCHEGLAANVKLARELAEAGSNPLYDRAYYESHCGIPYRRDEHWLGFFGGIADAIVDRIHPASVLDAGCAMGFLVEALRDRGVEAFGVDISEYAIAQVRADVRPHCWVGSITDALPRRYDLIVTIEVLEHLDEEAGREALANLARHSDDILFSSSPDDLEEETHANVRPTEYWAERFLEHGLLRDPEWEPSGGLPIWAIRFRRQATDLASTLSAYERLAYRQLRQTAGLRDELGQRASRVSELERFVSDRDAIIRDKDTHIGNLEAELRRIKASAAYRLAAGARRTLRGLRRDR